MKGYSEVDELVEQLKSKGASKPEIIVAAGEAEIGWPYVWGAVAAQCTPAKRQYYAGRSSCPDAEAKLIISGCQALNGSGKSCGGCQFYPNNMRTLADDCQGFVKQLCSRVGISLAGGGASSMWRTASNWSEKGEISTLPENKLCCIFWQNASDKSVMNHVGFYVGDGMMIHCSGTVKKEALSKKVTHWAIPRGLDGSVPSDRPTLRRGSKGEYVTLLQTMLIQRGYSLPKYGADGAYGKETEDAVRLFQRDWNLKQDGICGPATWSMLDTSPTRVKSYSVIIKGLDLTQAQALQANYPGSELKED